MGRHEEQKLPLPFAVNCHVDSGCLMESNLSREDLPFVFLLEAIFHHCHPGFLLSVLAMPVHKACKSFGGLINRRGDTIAFEVHLGLAASKSSDCWTDWESFLIIFCYFIPEVTLFCPHVFHCLWIFTLLGRTRQCPTIIP